MIIDNIRTARMDTFNATRRATDEDTHGESYRAILAAIGSLTSFHRDAVREATSAATDSVTI